MKIPPWFFTKFAETQFPGQIISGNALVPCQGLDFGYVIAKRPPLSDFV